MSDSDDPYPGREFVAMLDCHPSATFGERCDRLLRMMKAEGLRADCPGVDIFSGILVPNEDASRARAFLRTLRLNWMTGWVSEGFESQGFQFGYYDESS